MENSAYARGLFSANLEQGKQQMSPPPTLQKPSQVLRLSWLVVPFTLARTKNASFDLNLMCFVMIKALHLSKKLVIWAYIPSKCAKRGLTIHSRMEHRVAAKLFSGLEAINKKIISDAVTSMFHIVKLSSSTREHIFVLVTYMTGAWQSDSSKLKVRSLYNWHFEREFFCL